MQYTHPLSLSFEHFFLLSLAIFSDICMKGSQIHVLLIKHNAYIWLSSHARSSICYAMFMFVSPLDIYTHTHTQSDKTCAWAAKKNPHIKSHIKKSIANIRWINTPSFLELQRREIRHANNGDETGRRFLMFLDEMNAFLMSS
jgi:hypothetical protein